MLKNFAFSGYRSFGSELQMFEKLGKINLFIGPNNCGKSNILKFIKHAFSEGKGKLDDLEYHYGGDGRIIVATGQSISKSEGTHRIHGYSNFTESDLENKIGLGDTLQKLLKIKAAQDSSGVAWSKWDLLDNNLSDDEWVQSIEEFCRMHERLELRRVWDAKLAFRGRFDADKVEKIQQLASVLQVKPMKAEVHMIPAIREVSAQGLESEDFSGRGLIHRLARLEKPNAYNQKDKIRFRAIREFLRCVTDQADAEIEVPHDNSSVIVHMNGRSLPIESLGSGIHEVIILAAAATVIQDAILCIEEPELHLNPILQRKLIRYLNDHTSNQYFIATHSHVLMDTPDAEIYRVRLEDGKSKVERVTSGRNRRQVCEDLGYHPSDLLQSNCIVWVEGPSDRIYLNHWLSRLAPELQEQVHYSIMFYGGRLASHLSNADLEVAPEDLISLRRLNSRSCILIDSDKASVDAQINATKQRLQSEFDTGPGFAWVTAGREIENYLDSDQLDASIRHSRPSSTPLGQYSQFDNPLKMTNSKGEPTQANKVEVARHYVQQIETDPFPYDLQDRLRQLIAFVRDSNPTA